MFCCYPSLKLIELQWYAPLYMELRHLRYFCAVAEHRSFTIAARHLNVSQSGVSGQVHSLEQELGVTLLQRNSREVRLTPEGVLFAAEAREILLRAERAIELTRRSSTGNSGTLTVGLCGPVTSLFLPALIRNFRQQFPGVDVALRERAPAEQIDALLNGEIDIAFTRSIPAERRPLVHQRLLFREPLIAAIPRRHPLAAEDSVAVPALASSRLVLYYRDGAPEIFDAILALCSRAKFSPRLADTPSSWQSILTMVEAGEGVALVPACVRRLRANDVVFRPLRGRPTQFDAIVAWRLNEPSATVERFLALLPPATRSLATTA